MNYLLSAIILLLTSFSVSLATVGGDAHNTRYSYNEKDTNIFYLYNSGDAGNCSEYIIYINSKTGVKKESIMSPCDSGEPIEKLQTREKNPETGKVEYTGSVDYEKVDKYVETIFSKLIPLKEVNFKKDGISTKTSFTKDKKGNIDYGWDTYTGKTTISINSLPISTLSFRSCKPSARVIFTGYSIPKSKNILVNVRTLSSCEEGGYEADQSILVKNFYKNSK